MFYKKAQNPGPSQGIRITEADQTVPDQSLSLAEILRRFTRHEVLPVGHKGQYGSEVLMDPENDSDLNVDVEKLRHADLTEKQDYRNNVRDHLEQWKREEDEREAKAKREKAERIAQKKAAREQSSEPPKQHDPKGSI